MPRNSAVVREQIVPFPFTLPKNAQNATAERWTSAASITNQRKRTHCPRIHAVHVGIEHHFPAVLFLVLATDTGYRTTQEGASSYRHGSDFTHRTHRFFGPYFFSFRIRLQPKYNVTHANIASPVLPALKFKPHFSNNHTLGKSIVFHDLTHYMLEIPRSESTRLSLLLLYFISHFHATYPVPLAGWTYAIHIPYHRSAATVIIVTSCTISLCGDRENRQKKPDCCWENCWDPTRTSFPFPWDKLSAHLPTVALKKTEAELVPTQLFGGLSGK